MKMQETFDTIVSHARTMDCKAAAEDGECMYRGINNTKCFIGCLIPDSLYTEKFENKNIQGVLKLSKELRSLLIPESSSCEVQEEWRMFYADLQKIHDAQDIGDWEYDFYKLAKTYDLKYEEPKL